MISSILMPGSCASSTSGDAGVPVVMLLDDQEQFETVYPKARTLRDGAPYPIRVHRVAAARRAQQLAAGAAGQSRIAVAAGR